MFFIRPILLCLLFCLFKPVFSQTLQDEKTYRTWCVTDGIPQLDFNTAVQNRQGFMWIKIRNTKDASSNTSDIWARFTKKVDFIISLPYWYTWWFRLLLVLFGFLLILVFVNQRINYMRKKDQQRLLFERETMELEAQALRSQMNPHFIFNCLNSIKSLIQEGDTKRAIDYLMTFAKLLRKQLENDHREISLKEELETISFYLRLEAFRFYNKISYQIDIDPQVDISTIKLPPLLLQPFVENAIIHGIIPLNREGVIRIRVWQKEVEWIMCEIEDNGIGREKAAFIKRNSHKEHQSKGVSLVKHRLNLHNQLKNLPITVSIIDKKNEQGISSGTLVIISFNLTTQHD